MVPCGLDCSKKSSRVKFPTTGSTLGLLVITFRVSSMRMFVEEGISDMETTLLALGDCSKGLQLSVCVCVCVCACASVGVFQMYERQMRHSPNLKDHPD